MSGTHVHDLEPILAEGETIGARCDCGALETAAPSPCAGAETQLVRDARVAELAHDCAQHAADAWAAARATVAIGSAAVMACVAAMLAAWWLR